MSSELSQSAGKFQSFLNALGAGHQVVELPDSTRTAAEAAAAIGCEVGQIAKSIVFRSVPGGKAVLVVASGVNRISEKQIAALVGERIEKADADFVRAATGFAIGGIPPAGHLSPLPTIIDEDLLKLDVIWAAAGSPHAVFRLSATDLARLTGGTVATIKQ